MRMAASSNRMFQKLLVRTIAPATAPTPSVAASSTIFTHRKGSRQNLGSRLNRHRISFASSPYCPSFEEKRGIASSPGPLVPPKMRLENQNCGRDSTAKRPPSLPLPHHDQTSKFITFPTILTLGRVAAIPLLVSAFYINSWWGTTATTSIFIAAAITDWLDGFIARKMRLGTAFGAFLDPVADKLIVAVTLVLLCSSPLEISTFGEVPWLFTVPAITIIGREITMSAVREWAASQNNKLVEVVAVNNLGKWKTATQMTALTILLVSRDSNVAGVGILVTSGVVLLNASAGLAMWSLVVYMMKVWKVLLK